MICCTILYYTLLYYTLRLQNVLTYNTAQYVITYNTAEYAMPYYSMVQYEAV